MVMWYVLQVDSFMLENCRESVKENFQDTIVPVIGLDLTVNYLSLLYSKLRPLYAMVIKNCLSVALKACLISCHIVHSSQMGFFWWVGMSDCSTVITRSKRIWIGFQESPFIVVPRGFAQLIVPAVNSGLIEEAVVPEICMRNGLPNREIVLEFWWLGAQLRKPVFDVVMISLLSMG